MKKRIVSSAIFLLFAADPAWANVVVRNSFDPATVLLILVLEAVLAARIARSFGLEPERVFVAWLGTTLVTFALFVKFTSDLKSLSFISRVAIGELWVIILEGLVLYLMSHSSYFRGGRSGPLELQKAVKVSAVANIASILMGLLLAAPPVFSGANRSVRLFEIDVMASATTALATVGPLLAEIIFHETIHLQPAVGILAFEALLAAIVLCRMGFRPFRVFLVWFLTMSSTFALFVRFVARVENASVFQRLFAGVVCVIILDALALYVTGLIPFFRPGRSGRLPAGRALAVSAFVNVESVLAGLWAISVFIFLSVMA